MDEPVWPTRGTSRIVLVGFCLLVIGVVMMITGVGHQRLEDRLSKLESRVNDIVKPRPAPVPGTGRADVKPPGEGNP